LGAGASSFYSPAVYPVALNLAVFGAGAFFLTICTSSLDSDATSTILFDFGFLLVGLSSTHAFL